MSPRTICATNRLSLEHYVAFVALLCCPLVAKLNECSFKHCSLNLYSQWLLFKASLKTKASFKFCHH